MTDATFPTDAIFLTPQGGKGGLTLLSDDGTNNGATTISRVRGLITVTLSADTTLDATYLGKLVEVDTTSAAAAITLPPSTGLVDGDMVRLRHSAGANLAKAVFSAADVAWLTAIGDQVVFRWDGSTWRALHWNILPRIDDFTGSGTWTKPPLVSEILVELCGGGGGGGSGRKGAAGSVRCGGGCGGHAPFYRERLAPADVAATETVTIGALGAGGAAQATNSTSGNNGTAGGTTTFGTTAHVAARGGGLGSGGTASTGSQGTSYGGSLNGSITNGPGASATGGSPAAQATNYATGNASSGGGITSGDAASAGGSAARMANDLIGTAPAGGANTGVAGGSGATDTSRPWWLQGQPGAGGGANLSGAAGAGGAASGYGLGGGGGGASLDATGNSGAGGNGSPGFCRVISRF